MDLAKLKQIDEQNEKKRQDYRAMKMNDPIKTWETRLNSDEFENELQKELEDELNAGERLSIHFAIAYEFTHYADKSYISLYGRFVSQAHCIIDVGLNNYNYKSYEVEELANSMYKMLKNKLANLGFVITKEDKELEVRYNAETEITLHLKIK